MPSPRLRVPPRGSPRSSELLDALRRDPRSDAPRGARHAVPAPGAQPRHALRGRRRAQRRPLPGRERRPDGRAGSLRPLAGRPVRRLRRAHDPRRAAPPLPRPRVDPAGSARPAGAHPRRRGDDHEARQRPRALADRRARSPRSSSSARTRCSRRWRPATHAARCRSTSRPAGDEVGDASIGERVGGEDPGFELVEERSAISAGARVLSDLEREVLRLRFVEDLTQSKIAERVGYSQMHVSRILRRALERVRAASERDAFVARLSRRARRGSRSPACSASAVALDAHRVGETLQRGVDLGYPHPLEQPVARAVDERPHAHGDRRRRPRPPPRSRSPSGKWLRGLRRDGVAQAAPRRRAGRPRSSPRTAKIEMTRESTGPTSSPAGIDIAAQIVRRRPRRRGAAGRRSRSAGPCASSPRCRGRARR